MLLLQLLCISALYLYCSKHVQAFILKHLPMCVVNPVISTHISKRDAL